MRRSIFFFLIFPLGIFALIDTQVTVNYVLSCERRDSFWYKIELLEEDLHADDLLAKQEGTGERRVEGTIVGKDNGDPGNEYEFFILIKHNCGANGKLKRVELRPVCLLGTPNCDYNIFANLDMLTANVFILTTCAFLIAGTVLGLAFGGCKVFYYVRRQIRYRRGVAETLKDVYYYARLDKAEREAQRAKQVILEELQFEEKQVTQPENQQFAV